MPRKTEGLPASDTIYSTELTRELLNLAPATRGGVGEELSPLRLGARRAPITPFLSKHDGIRDCAPFLIPMR